MAYGIDSQINERVDMYSSDPQKLMQRYTQSQSLLDLLALQKLKSEKEAAMRNMQTQMQPPMNTVRDQREQQVFDMTRNEVAQQAMQGGQQLALNKQREMQARGLPAQAAPNMQGMAMGGIVGYQEGGFMGPPEANMLQRMGQGLKNYGANAQESMGILKEAKAGMGLPYEERSAVMKQVRDEIEAQNQNRDPNFIERMGQKLMGVGLDVEESKAILKKFYDNMGKTYEQKASGMAMGGGVKRFQEGMKVEADLPQEVLDEIERLRRISELNAQMETTPRQRSALSRGVNELTPEQAARNEALRTQAAAVRTSTGEVAREEIFTPISDASIGIAEGGNAADNTTRQELFNELATIGDAQTETPRTNLVTPEVEARMQTAASADPTALAEAAEKRRAALAQTAYGIPQALQDAYATRQKSVDEANAAMNDPKKQSRDEFRAMLSGFATPGGIARSGIAAGQGVAGVQEAAIQRKKDQGEEAFGITKELADLQRAASIEAYKSGEQGYDRAYRSAATAANASFQALSNIDIGAQNRANANRLADRSAKLETINMQLRSLESQDNMKSRDRNTQVTILNGAQRDASSIRGEIQKAIAESSFLSEAKRRPYLDYIAARKAELQATQSRIDAVAATLGIQTTSPAASGAGTGSTALPAGFVPD